MQNTRPNNPYADKIPKGATHKRPSVKAKITKLIDREDSPVKAIADLCVGGAFYVHGLRVMQSEKKGLFVLMPQSSYQKNGETVYTDIFHANSADGRSEIVNAVLSEYQNELNMQGWKEVMDYDEDDAGFDQSMQ